MLLPAREELKRIENEASSPDFWNDQEAAQKLLQKRTVLEKKIQRQEHFESQIADAAVLFEFAEEDEESLKELRAPGRASGTRNRRGGNRNAARRATTIS